MKIATNAPALRGVRPSLRAARITSLAIAALIPTASPALAAAFDLPPTSQVLARVDGAAPRAPNANGPIVGQSMDTAVTGQRPIDSGRLEVQTHNANGLQTADVSARAKQSSGSLTASVASTLRYNPPAIGTSGVQAVAQAVFNDRLTINGQASDLGRHVTLHGVLTLTELANTHDEFFGPGADDVSIDNTGFARLGGSGFAPSMPDPADFHRTLDNVNGVTLDTSDAAPASIAFTQNVVVGDAADISIALSVFGRSVLFDANGQGFTAASFALSYNLSWDPGSFFVTFDDADGQDTGQRANRFTAASVAGIGYLAPGGSVPEPASWALMIAGFGLAGAGLRRRRTALAAA